MLAGFFIERWLADGHLTLTQFLRGGFRLCGYRTAHARDQDKIEFSVECAPELQDGFRFLTGDEPKTLPSVRRTNRCQ